MNGSPLTTAYPAECSIVEIKDTDCASPGPKKETPSGPPPPAVFSETGELKYATQEYLIDTLFSEKQESPDYVLNFLLTMDFFIKPLEFYDILVQRYNKAKNDREKKIALSVLNTWVLVMWTPTTDKTLVSSAESLAKSVPWEDMAKVLLDSLKEKTSTKDNLKSVNGIKDDDADIFASTSVPVPLAFRTVEIIPEKTNINFLNTNVTFFK